MAHLTRDPSVRVSSAARDDRTSSRWREHCQNILRELAPDYRAEGPFSARKIEIRRTLDSGLIASHSYFVHRSCDYHQGFAVLWSTAPEKSPYSLLRVGTRFFDRPLSEMLAMDEIPRPSCLRDSQTWRSNSIELLSRSLAAVEQEVLPAYLTLIDRGAHRLARFFATAHEMVSDLPARIPKDPEARARLLRLDAHLLEPYRSPAWVVTATDILLARPPYTDIPAAVRDRAVVLARLDDLVASARELSDITRTLGAI